MIPLSNSNEIVAIMGRKQVFEKSETVEAISKVAKL
jgi:hypothetical protein